MKLILPDGSTRIAGCGPATVEEVLLREGINPLDVMVSCNGRLLAEDALVGGDDEIRIRQISHGG